METLQAILTRRSVRQYTNTPVPPVAIETMLRAAMAAPSAMNQQPWHFIVVDDRATLNRIAKENPHADMCVHAPLAILVCGDALGLRTPAHWDQDCSAATQNLLLAAHGIGLGAVWTSAYPSPEIGALYRDMFGLPGDVTPLALVAIGYPIEQPEQEDRYREERVHRNRW